MFQLTCLLGTGCWICLNNLTYVKVEVLSTFAQFFAHIVDALRAQKQNINEMGDEIPLSPDGACFSVIDTSIKVSSRDPDELMLFKSASCQLPEELLSNFRVVSLVTPDYKLMLEALLISQGSFTVF